MLTHPLRDSAPLAAIQENEPDTSFVGHLIESSISGETTMHYVAPYGIDDGTFSIPTKSVTVIEWGTRYLAAIEGMRQC